MEENRKLPKAELVELNSQYYDLTADLKQYRRLQWSRDFKKALPEQQKSIKSQYRFFKSVLNGTLETLISQEGLNHNVATDALINLFVPLRLRWKVILYLVKTPKL